MDELTPEQIAQQAEDLLRQICALEGIDFEAAKARRQGQSRGKTPKKS